MKTLLMAAAFSAALVAGPASAQMYFGAGGGEARTNSSETSWKAYGGYQFTPTWGAEVGYNDLGRYNGANIESWTLAGTGKLPLGERWSLLGKLGAAANRPEFAGAANRTDLLFGVGVGYSLNKNLGLRLEYEDFGSLSKVGNPSNSRGTNLGLSLNYSL